MPATQKATNPIETVICNTITPQLDQQPLMWDTVKGFFKIKEYYISTIALVNRCSPIFKCFKQVGKARFMVSEAMLFSRENIFVCFKQAV